MSLFILYFPHMCIFVSVILKLSWRLMLICGVYFLLYFLWQTVFLVLLSLSFCSVPCSGTGWVMPVIFWTHVKHCTLYYIIQHIFINVFACIDTVVGYWCHIADERLGNPPQGNQEPLVVKGKTPGELGVSKSVECVTFIQCCHAVGSATGRASGL